MKASVQELVSIRFFFCDVFRSASLAIKYLEAQHLRFWAMSLQEAEWGDSLAWGAFCVQVLPFHSLYSGLLPPLQELRAEEEV